MAIEIEKARAAGEVRQSSDRQFGLVMAAFFLLLTAYSAWKHSGLPRWHWPALSAGFAFFALLLPEALRHLNLAWSLFGRLLHKVMSPLVMGLVYFGFIAPFGVIFRVVKGDPLRLKIDKNAASYWVERKDDDQPGGGMANQF